MDINNENLENSLTQNAQPEAPKQEAAPQMSKEMEIGFHQGALRTLFAERAELVKMIGNVDIYIQGHVKRLEELGVKVQTQQQ